MRLIKSRQRFIGTIILILCYSFIIHRLVQFQSWQQFKLLFSGSVWNVAIIVCAELFLASINILVESKKWQLLISGIREIKILTSYKMVLAGYSSGIFTPGKIGEPVGRLVSFPKKHWAKGTLLNYFGGIIHNVVIIITGLTCTTLMWMQTDYHPYQKIMLYILSILAFFILMSFSIWHFRDHFRAVIKRFNLHEKLNETLSVIRSISIHKGLTIFTLSIVRYGIYCLQLYIIFYTLGAGSNPLFILSMIPIYFMVITLIPSFLLADIGVRSSVALLLFSSTALSEPAIILSVFTVWMINQVIPAIAGSLFFIPKNKYQEEIEP